MSVAKRDFVTTAKISGVSAPVILFRHLLPNVSGTIAVQGTYALSVGILVEGRTELPRLRCSRPARRWAC